MLPVAIERQRVSRIIPHLCGMSQRLRGKRWLMMFRAFFDESGLNPKEDKAFIMGGFLARVEDWERVSEQWDTCLRQHPVIEYFKSDEARNLSGQFGRLSRLAAEKKKSALAQVIGDADIQGFCATVKYRDFVNRDARANKAWMGGRIYDWGFLTSTSGLLQYMRSAHPGEKVDFIFDSRSELPLCIATLEELKGDDGSPWSSLMQCAGSCISGDDKEIAALQMADLLAGEVSSMVNSGDKASESWRVIAGKKRVIHITCDLPPTVSILLAARGAYREISISNTQLARRLYKENERSEALAKDFHDLSERAVFFSAAINSLKEEFEADPEFIKFRERLRARPDLE